ncbi:MAG: M23 family metallopeptidase [Deltaproteobacteria bacterium]|nr:M23 family metallopeptidase [Deltaproteobacteria bacterium]
MVVPERSSEVRRIQIPRLLINALGILLLLVVATFSAAGAHYYYIIDQAVQNGVLLKENAELRGNIEQISAKLDEVNGTLNRVDLFDRKLREITRLSDPARGLAIGPVNEPLAVGGAADIEAGLFAAPPEPQDPEQQQLEFALLDARLLGLAGEARRQETSLRELSHYFDEQSALLENTPSVWPVQGWVTSEFGMRDDPYTGARTMHLGVDISTAEGKAIIAPANGVVSFAGERGGYGWVLVVDHGLGISSFYGHLKEMLVQVGDKVVRGQHIASVGNTGRSTGPHLHYEVRAHDLPVNPRIYILQ